MKALTLHGCYAYAVIHGGKNVENRSWDPPESLFGQRIAIHAGKNPGDKYAQAQMRVIMPTAPAWPSSAVIGTVRLAGFFVVVDDEVTYCGTVRVRPTA